MGLVRDTATLQPSRWMFSNGTVLVNLKEDFNLWAPSQPEDGTGDHAVVGHDGHYNQDGNKLHYYICQFREPLTITAKYKQNQFGFKPADAQAMIGDIIDAKIQQCSVGCTQKITCTGFSYNMETKSCSWQWLNSDALSLVQDDGTRMFDKLPKQESCQTVRDCFKVCPALNAGSNVVMELSESFPDGSVHAGHTAVITCAGFARTLYVNGNKHNETVLSVKCVWPYWNQTVTELQCTSEALIIIFGGYSNPSTYVSYNPDDATYNNLQGALNPGRYMSVVEVIGKKIIVAGGYSNSDGYLDLAQIYDPTTNSFSDIEKMKNRRHAAGSGVIDDVFYICGGTYDTTDVASNTCEKYENDQWALIAPMSTNRYYFAMVALNAKLYAIGGATKRVDGLKLSSVEMYDPSLDEWDSVKPLPLEITDLRAATLHGHIFTCGGIDSGSAVLNKCYKYSPYDDLWSPITEMEEKRYAASVVSLGGKLIVLGGKDFSTYKDPEVYDRFYGTWDIIPNSNIVRSHAAAVAYPILFFELN